MNTEHQAKPWRSLTPGTDIAIQCLPWSTTVRPTTTPEPTVTNNPPSSPNPASAADSAAAPQRQTAELRAPNDELTRFNGVAVSREQYLPERKLEPNALCVRLDEPARHRLAETGPGAPAITKTPS